MQNAKSLLLISIQRQKTKSIFFIFSQLDGVVQVTVGETCNALQCYT